MNQPTEEEKWKSDKNHLANKLYAEIFPILSQYEVRGFNAHQRTQSIVEKAIEQSEDWVLKNIRGQ